MRILLILLLALSASTIQAQNKELVQWTVELNEDKTAIKLKATMDDDWVIYSQYTDPEGPIPLEFDFEETAGVVFVEGVKELTKPLTKLSALFGVEVMKFEHSAEFEQAITISTQAGIIKGNVTFMTCDATRCLPPKTVPFEVKI